MIRRWLLALLVTAAVVAIFWIYVDRAVAGFVTLHFHNTPVWRVSARILMPIPVVALIAPGFLLVHTMRIANGASPAPWTRLPATGAWAMSWALALTVILKRLIGRTEIYPSWLFDHVYTVHPIFWRPNSEAFPSGTMLIGTALIAVLWRRMPAGRPAWAGAVIILAALLILTDSHWVSDIIAGIFLGATVGWLTSATMPAEAERAA